MKKISNLFIALFVVAMFFSGCKFLGDVLPEDRTATIEDFQGTWQWNSGKTVSTGSNDSTNQTELTDKVNSLLFVIENDSVFMKTNENKKGGIEFYATVENGVLTATNDFMKDSLMMTIKVGKANMTVTGGTLLYDLVGETVINPTKAIELDTSALPFIPDTTVTFENYEGTWTNIEKNVTFSFGTETLTGKNLQFVNIVGLTNEFNMPNLVIVAKGVATTTVNNAVYLMYMNKEHNGITVTGPKIKELTEVYCFNLEKNTK